MIYWLKLFLKILIYGCKNFFLLNRQKKTGLSFFILILLFFSGSYELRAHDINSNKITLIMREKSHVSLIMSVNILKAMNQFLAPHTKYSDFVLAYSNMDTRQFQKEYEKTKDKITFGILVSSSEQSKLTIRDWRWPQSSAVQKQFQDYVMELMTGNHDHTKEPLLEVFAEIIDKVDKTKIQVQVPKEIQPILFISYKPTTIWSRENKVTNIDF